MKLRLIRHVSLNVRKSSEYISFFDTYHLPSSVWHKTFLQKHSVLSTTTANRQTQAICPLMFRIKHDVDDNQIPVCIVKLTGAKSLLEANITSLYWAPRFIIMYTRAHHWSVSSDKLGQLTLSHAVQDTRILCALITLITACALSSTAWSLR
jgi:hypothetical protein